MPARRLPGLPALALDRRSATPLYRQIYQGYRTAIAERRLRAGQRMPSTRGLAEELGLSRIPVLNAFEQLIAEGYLEARTGAGTFVSASLPSDGPRPIVMRAKGNAAPNPKHRAVAKMLPHLTPEIDAWFKGLGAFKIGEVGADGFPFTTWSRLISRHAHKLSAKSLRYGPSHGHEGLRIAIADYLRTTRAMRCEADQVMVVSGSQQALSLCGRVLFDPGDKVWFEEPGYRGAHDALEMSGATLIPVPVDEDGLDVGVGIARAPEAKAAYATPSHQYPLGVTMSASRRMQLLNWAESGASWILEDDYDSEYRYESLPVAALQGLDRHDRVLYIGTFSKVLFPSLRLGYLVVPPDLVPRFRAVRRAMDISPPTFMQAVLADFLTEGHFALHIRRMRRRYREGRSALVEALRTTLGPEFKILGDQAGMHLVVELPDERSDLEVARVAAEVGLLVMPLSTAYSARPARQGLVLGYGAVAIPDLRAGVRLLSTVLRKARSGPVPPRAKPAPSDY